MKWETDRIDEVKNDCCWCKKEVSHTGSSDVFGILASFREDVNTPPVRKNPYYIYLKLPESLDSEETKNVRGIVTGEDSQAKKEGCDLIFQVCSEDCRDEMVEILNTGIEFFDNFAFKSL